MSSYDHEDAPRSGANNTSPTQQISLAKNDEGFANTPSQTPLQIISTDEIAMGTAVENEVNVQSTLEGKTAAMVICWLLGIGSLLSWYTMLSVGDYYYKVFPSHHPSRVLALVYQPFFIGAMVVLAYYISKVNSIWRNTSGFTLYFCSSFGCLLLDLATSGKGGGRPFAILCILVGLFGVADALVRGGISGDLASMLPELMQSYYGGMAASGALTSGLRFVTKAAFDKSVGGLRKGALLFLSISTGIEFLCIFLYAICFSELPIVRYYRAKAYSEGSSAVVGLAVPDPNKVVDAEVDECLTLKQLLCLNWDYVLDLYLTYAISLSIFPGFLYENVGSHSLGAWYSLVLIATYNASDFVGRYAPLLKFMSLESRKGLMIASFSRLIFVPIFYFIAKFGDQGWMIMVTALLGFTNGHLTVSVMTLAPKGYKVPEQKALGNLLVLFLALGLLSGTCLDWLWTIGS